MKELQALQAENVRLTSEHERIFTGQTAYEPPPYEEVVSAYDVNRNVDDAVKRPLRWREDGGGRAYKSQQRGSEGWTNAMSAADVDRELSRFEQLARTLREGMRG